jgi:hypothetical protein
MCFQDESQLERLRAGKDFDNALVMASRTYVDSDRVQSGESRNLELQGEDLATVELLARGL